MARPKKRLISNRDDEEGQMLKFLLPETYSAPPAARRRYALRSALTVLTAFAAAGLVMALGATIPETVRAAVLLLVVAAALLVFVYEFVALLRSLDELQQRLHILACAIGAGAAALIVSLAGAAQLLFGWESFNLPLTRLVTVLLPVLALPLAGTVYYVAVFWLARRYG